MAKKNPTYCGVTVNEQWRHFMAFRAWFIANYKDGYHLDKDILTDTRQYGPDTCLFIPQWLNGFLTDSRAQRGDYLIGTSKPTNGRFRAMFDEKVLGNYDTELEAHLAWRDAKLEKALSRKTEMDAIDMRIYPRIVEIVNRMR